MLNILTNKMFLQMLTVETIKIKKLSCYFWLRIYKNQFHPQNIIISFDLEKRSKVLRKHQAFLVQHNTKNE